MQIVKPDLAQKLQKYFDRHLHGDILSNKQVDDVGANPGASLFKP